MSRRFDVVYANEPQRNRSFSVRGICQHDILNPCWDDREDDVVGQHWGGGPACAPCTEAALNAQKKNGTGSSWDAEQVRAAIAKAEGRA